ncbi:MAG: glycosyltransferase [Oligoflexia bacterium]|nr:glycosyltransferase [Oligoflexia bacterium]
MHVQVFAPIFPYPCHEGAFITIAEQVKRLRELGYRVHLFYWKGADPSPQVLDAVFPGIEVTRLGSDRNEPATAARIAKSLFSKWSSAELFHYPPHLGGELDRLPTADLRIFHYSFSGPWLSRKRLSGKTAVVFHNLETELYRQRAIAEPRGPARWIHALNAKKLREHERRLSDGCDELWFLSPKDMSDFARSARPSVPLRVFPPFFSRAFLEARRKPRKKAARPVIGFVGGLHFRPNQVSAEWIVDQVAPELSKRGFAGRLLIVGKGPSSRLLEKAKAFPFVEVTGFLADLDPYWSDVSLSLSPHLEGSGVRMKLLESLAAGVPVLTHRMALEQLIEPLKHHPQLFATDSPAEWAEIIMKAPALPEPMTEGDRALTEPPAWFTSQGSAT